MDLSDEMIHDLNGIANWLALDDFPQAKTMNPDLMIIAGHAILPNIFGALTLAKNADIPVLLSGGIGHSTVLLQQAVKNNRLTAAIDTAGKSEAEILSSIAMTVFDIAADNLFIESASRNCGENADFSRELVLDKKIARQEIILVQDPLMQRRTTETFLFSWNKKGMHSRFISWPVFTPSIIMIGGEPMITGGQMPEVWEMERYIAMVLGEVKRLRDDQNGYGPSGAGFIGHVDIPDDVTRAWERLMRNPSLSESVR
ncbi:YdcF family protein [Dickeya solani]|uniref:YdcF family protein n=1 Tax=Dickeya solani TaxID=1089444 RepID=A0ABU4ED88_9GAMM|nr:YdcF family protein [Dickeya solani]MCA6998272.1 YdcF family protein [Dickeya solani]MCZ0823387.1 YdcF family protein [Dickeya solani]MDV6994123.1 YdcF family protein [Dickeya solani]MDV7004279.1 YdcF family protein [Dickeya solani]MDV7038352.1 YdcF family protein [Dickeya solani]